MGHRNSNAQNGHNNEYHYPRNRNPQFQTKNNNGQYFTQNVRPQWQLNGNFHPETDIRDKTPQMMDSSHKIIHILTLIYLIQEPGMVVQNVNFAAEMDPMMLPAETSKSIRETGKDPDVVLPALWAKRLSMSRGIITINIKINGKLVTTNLDTSSTENIISKSAPISRHYGKSPHINYCFTAAGGKKSLYLEQLISFCHLKISLSSLRHWW
ncbi:hypothetical protein HHI36_004906 [Cryptolaemus montrouzieri]|uniref:Uncharacterized protein n=1 Tax=Cryptolaemus montrouzieri TaxID=559131 RepID=A0ABD2NSQ8_9CUCU